MNKKLSKWCAFLLLLRFFAVGMMLDVMCYVAPVEAAHEMAYGDVWEEDDSEECPDMDCDEAIFHPLEYHKPHPTFSRLTHSPERPHWFISLLELERPPRIFS